MENASKALIIAGAILLSILIIALGIFVFNQAKGATNTDSLSDLEKSQFNQLFTNVEGNVIGSTVSSLLDKLVTNATTNKGTDERLPDLIYLDNRAATAGVLTNSSVSGSDATALDVNVSTKINSVGLNASNYKFQIKSYSDKENVAGFSAFRAKISPRHYYEVRHILSDETGLVEYVVVSY